MIYGSTESPLYICSLRKTHFRLGDDCVRYNDPLVKIVLVIALPCPDRDWIQLACRGILCFPSEGKTSPLAMIGVGTAIPWRSPIWIQLSRCRSCLSKNSFSLSCFCEGQLYVCMLHAQFPTTVNRLRT